MIVPHQPGSKTLHEAIRRVMSAAAERAILPRYGKLLAGDIREKTTDELVTVADQESEQILAEGLASILPDAAIVGEEAVAADGSVMDCLGQELCWIIDPLDGTANFASGHGPFGILVSLAEHGEAVGGWIYDPPSRRFCMALQGEGAFIDGEAALARPSAQEIPIAAISSLFVDPVRQSEVRERIEPAFQTVPIPRCAAEQYPRIALGVNDVTLYERTLPWDHAAGSVFLAEAGGRVSRFDGSPYRVDDERRGLIAAATPELWEQTVSLLRDLD